MRAERLGSYSIVATFAGIASFLPLEIDDAVLTARSAALVPDGDVAVVVAARVLLLDFGELALGSNFG